MEALYNNNNKNMKKTNISSLINTKPSANSQREDSYDHFQKAQIDKNLLASLSSFNGQNTTVLSPMPVHHPQQQRPHPPPTDNTDELLAIQALGQLKNSETPPPEEIKAQVKAVRTHDEMSKDDEDEEEEEGDEEYYDTSNDIDIMATTTGSSSSLLAPTDATSTGFIMRNIKSHPLYNSALRAYRINKPSIKYGVEMVERAAIPMVNMVEQTRLEWKRKKRLRRANAMFPDEEKFLPYRTSSLLSSTALYPSSSSSTLSNNLPSISEALLGNKNLHEFGLNLSIESKKRIATCLQLLMLANKQLSSKIQHLQNLITKQQEFLQNKKKIQKQDNYDEKIEEKIQKEEEETNTTTVQIKQEIVTTVKKVVSLISKYAGNSLPEPARSNVRETLLRLPTKWACTNTTNIITPSTTSIPSTSSSSTSFFNTSGKVLILANESLEMVSSVMSVFDETLTKAELWVKQKQEKQLAKAAILNNLHYNNSSTASLTSTTATTTVDNEDQVANNSNDNNDDQLTQ